MKEKCFCLTYTEVLYLYEISEGSVFYPLGFCVGFVCLPFISIQQDVFEIGLRLKVIMFVIFHCWCVSLKQNDSSPFEQAQGQSQPNSDTKNMF